MQQIRKRGTVLKRGLTSKSPLREAFDLMRKEGTARRKSFQTKRRDNDLIKQ